MKMNHNHGALLALLLLLAGGASAADRSAPALRLMPDQLASDTAGRARIVHNPATGAPSLIVLPPGALSFAGESAAAKAGEFVQLYGSSFGLDDPDRDLVLESSRSDDIGMTHLRFRQHYLGIPVFAGELRFHFDEIGRLASINGAVVPHLNLDPTPAIDDFEASAIARRMVAKDHGRAADELGSTDLELVVYRAGLVRGVPGANHLAWKMEVGDGAGIREFVFVDAHHGFVVDRFDGIHEIDRSIHHERFGNEIWTEGDALPFSDAAFTTEQNDEVNDLINVTSETYDLFSNITGGEWLSYDGNSRMMSVVYEATTFDPPCSESINASWNGRTTNFCNGLAVDDVIAHEWTHAYTDFTHNLIYAWQPGALNESFSDIFGEIVDLTNGHGLDSPNAKRTAGGCSTFFSAANFPFLTVSSPASIAGQYEARGAEFNPAGPWSQSGAVELVDDGSGNASDACEPLQGFTAGRIALIDRGDCPFVDKASNAADAGAAGVIIANNDGDDLVRMGGTIAGGYDTPAIFVTQTTGDALKAALGEGVQATISLQEPSDESVRWLVSEDGASGAFRDMWNPNCMFNPGRVSDSLYYCLEDDGGGVHFNSGVPNHAFALVVDGGTYNGVTVGAIGLTRAAHIYWRAMREYQGPATDFAEHADALELACADLVGAPLRDLVTGEQIPQVVRNSDCSHLAAAMLATEMRLEPTQCGFERILAPGTPPLGATNDIYVETFDADESLEDWTLTNEGVYPEYDTDRNWRVSTILPAGRDGGALYAIDSNFIGNCEPNDDDQSGVLMAESPTIHLPASATSMFVVFDHYVATEPGWDGGNLKLSVNGGNFELVPAEAFAFNAYNDTIILSITDDEQNEVPNSNPLGGEAAYTGTDEGSVESSWGQSQIDLSSLAAPGDSIRLRFDFGNDGCGGLQGWYIDSLKVVVGGQPTTSVLRPSRRVSP